MNQTLFQIEDLFNCPGANCVPWRSQSYLLYFLILHLIQCDALTKELVKEIYWYLEMATSFLSSDVEGEFYHTFQR